MNRPDSRRLAELLTAYALEVAAYDSTLASFLHRIARRIAR